MKASTHKNWLSCTSSWTTGPPGSHPRWSLLGIHIHNRLRFREDELLEVPMVEAALGVTVRYPWVIPWWQGPGPTLGQGPTIHVYCPNWNCPQKFWSNNFFFIKKKKKKEEGELSHFKMVPKLNIRNLTQLKILFFTEIVYINV